MSAHTEEAIKNHVKIYMRVFAALAILTVVTVSASFLHLPLLPAVLLALVIALFKGSLVAGFFMHLATEKKIVFAIMVLAVFFFLFLLILPAIHHF